MNSSDKSTKSSESKHSVRHDVSFLKTDMTGEIGKIKQIENFYHEIDLLVPKLLQMRSQNVGSLNRKEKTTLQYIFNLVDQSLALRPDFLRICAQFQQMQRSIHGEDLEIIKEGAGPSLAPERRLHSLRKAIEYKYLKAISGGLAHRIRHWDDDLKESCARVLAEEIEGAFGLLKTQKKDWESICRTAEFGSPSVVSRIKAMRNFFRVKQLRQEIDSERLKVTSLHQVYLKHRQGLESLASAVMSYFKISDSSSSSQSKKFEKLMRYETEIEIGEGIVKRGKSLLHATKQEKFLCEQKSTYCSQAIDFSRSRGLYHVDLRNAYEQARLYSPNSALERLVHSGFAQCAEELAPAIEQVKERREFLKHELHFQRAALLNRLSRLGKIVDSSSEIAEEHRQDEQAFVIPPKETITRF